ncbi:MAG: transposase [Caldimonas sp.]
MSTKILRGHVNPISDEVVDGRRRRRNHSPEFKAHVVALCRRSGVSIAAVAMANGVNANLVRRWVIEAERTAVGVEVLPGANDTSPAPSFVPLQLPAPAKAPASADIRIEIRRGASVIAVTWPSSAAGECASWMRELLR